MYATKSSTVIAPEGYGTSEAPQRTETSFDKKKGLLAC
jgi:hypothetical protein